MSWCASTPCQASSCSTGSSPSCSKASSRPSWARWLKQRVQTQHAALLHQQQMQQGVAQTLHC
jgi:hypothetical protein